MKHFYRFIQIIFTLLIILWIPFALKKNYEHIFEVIGLPLFFIGFIAVLQFIINSNYSNKINDTTTLHIPFSTHIKKTNLLVGIIVQVILILILKEIFIKHGYIPFVFTIFIMYFFYKIFHMGNIRFWNHCTLKIEKNGFKHYKYGFIPWSNIREIDTTIVKHRGMKVGEHLVFRLKKSYLSNRSSFRKNWEGIIFKNSRVLSFPQFMSHIPINTLFIAVMDIYKHNGGDSLKSITIDSKFINNEDKAKWFLDFRRYEYEDDELESLYKILSEVENSLRDNEKLLELYNNDDDSSELNSRYAKTFTKSLSYGSKQLELMKKIDQRTKEIKKVKSTRLLIVFLLILVIVIIYTLAF